MSFIITILAALLVFSAVIAIHEFRHSGQRVFHRHGAGALEKEP